jgi:hypothetical protein
VSSAASAREGAYVLRASVRSRVMVCPGCVGAVELDWIVDGNIVPTGELPAAPEPVDGELMLAPVDCAQAVPPIREAASASTTPRYK